jgi:hypothetical protein
VRRGLAAALVAAVVASLAGGTAAAEEATRTSFREAVEPICQANTKANERILAGVRSEVKHDRLTIAARKFRKAGTALKGTLGELRQVPRPSADSARLSRWFGFISTEVGFFEKTAGYLAAGKKETAEGMVVRLEGTARRANNAVVPFEFHYCLFEPSRFT